MSITIPTIEPTEIISGDTVTWEILPENTEFYASNGYTMSYALRGTAGAIDITTTADGSYHKVLVSAATTALWTDGTYYWQSYVTKGTERYAFNTGTIVIEKNYAGINSSVAITSRLDKRSKAERILAAIDDAILNKATDDITTIQVDGDMVIKGSLNDLLQAQDRYRTIVLAEENAKRLAEGKSSLRIIKTRFV